MITTLGRELVRQKLPEGYKEWADKPLDKKNLSALTTKLALENPDQYVDILQDLQTIGEKTVSTYGKDASLSFTQIAPGKPVQKLRSQLRQIIDKVLDDDSLTEQQKEDKIINLGYKYQQRIQDAVFNDQDSRHTALAGQINSGTRGNKTQLMQLAFGSMCMKDPLGRDIPYLHTDPYITGASPFTYWASAMGARKNMIDVQMATGKSGYMGKQVTAITHDVTIEKDDCGTDDTGVPFKAANTQNIGRVLLRPFHNHPAGSVVDAKMIAEADDDEEMILRTPMTCKCRTGVCAKCNGLSENGKFPGVGSMVALNSARSFVEKLTQAAVGSKHGSGGNKRVENPEGEDQPTGLDSINRMVRAPSNFPGGAVLAPVDGTVTGIKEAPQGGTYVTVGTQTVYCSPARTLKVKTGDKLEAGDVLTNGVPNPSEVVKYKGTGAGRYYYLNRMGTILKEAGAGVDRSNLESFSRSMMNKVRITSDDGYRDYLPGSVVDYSDIAADYTPRENAVTEDVSKASNMYLEKPVLYYSIGTRITPSVANNLNKYGFKQVTVSPDPPPFSAEFMPPAKALQNDKHWLPRMSGERLYDSLFDAAQKGITDAYDSASYIDKIVTAPYKP